MKALYKKGDNKFYRKVVTQEDLAAFHGKKVHEVCSTFALARDMEWSSRLFVLDMVEEHEEGIGTFLSIDHAGPAFPGEELIFKATIDSINDNEIICNIEVNTANRKVAIGKTGQKVILKDKLKDYFEMLKNK